MPPAGQLVDHFYLILGVATAVFVGPLALAVIWTHRRRDR